MHAAVGKPDDALADAWVEEVTDAWEDDAVWAPPPPDVSKMTFPPHAAETAATAKSHESRRLRFIDLTSLPGRQRARSESRSQRPEECARA